MLFWNFLAKDRKQAAANMPVVVLSLNLRFDRVGREASKGFYYHLTPAVDHCTAHIFLSSTALHASQTNMIAAHMYIWAPKPFIMQANALLKIFMYTQKNAGDFDVVIDLCGSDHGSGKRWVMCQEALGKDSLQFFFLAIWHLPRVSLIEWGHIIQVVSVQLSAESSNEKLWVRFCQSPDTRV